MAENDQSIATSSTSERPAKHEQFDFADVPMLVGRMGRWFVKNPLIGLLIAAVVGVVAWFYFGIMAFNGKRTTAAQWIVAGWSAENDQEHCWGIIPVALGLVLLRWREIAASPKVPSNSGLWFVGLGILLFVAGVRCTEARYTIFAIPALCYGTTRFLLGRNVARLVLFPCIFLLFMTPVGGLVQGTVPLQVMTANAIQFMSRTFGIPIVVDGSTITFVKGDFEPMEVAGGCSGIRSLMAMTTLSALYAYFTMRGPIRGVILFASSLLFAVLGNFARVFSVVLFARFVDAKTATGLYHDYSGFVFFPVAVFAMVSFGSLLNRDWEAVLARWLPASPASGRKIVSTEPAKIPTDSTEPGKKKEPLSYDY